MFERMTGFDLVYTGILKFPHINKIKIYCPYETRSHDWVWGNWGLKQNMWKDIISLNGKSKKAKQDRFSPKVGCKNALLRVV